MSTAPPASGSPSPSDVDTPRNHSPSEAETYAVEAWGDGFFAIGDRGTVQVRPDRDPARQIGRASCRERV